jgi:hypothetical protein
MRVLARGVRRLNAFGALRAVATVHLRVTLGAVPVTYTVADRLLTVRCEGTYSVGELRQLWIDVAAMRDLPLPIACVLDIRDSESILRRSVSDMRSIAEAFLQRAAIADRRLAIVTSGGARFGLMRMATTWIELAGIEAKVFRELAEAQSWALNSLAPRARHTESSANRDG